MTQASAIPAAYMRGGTSKGVFLHHRDLPPMGPERDALLLAIMGSPDALQIDGMGGTTSSTSKVIVVEPQRDNTIAYWFAQIGVDRAVVDWSGNCGNLTSAVAPFAIDEGLVDGVPAVGDAEMILTLLNMNTGVRIESVVHTRDGQAAVTGEYEIAGVPGTAAPIATNYLEPAGGVLGALLPTGQPSQRIVVDGRNYEISVVDAAHPNVFVSASAFGVRPGALSIGELNAKKDLLYEVEALRAATAVLLGVAADSAAATAQHPAVPRIILVAEATAEPGDERNAQLDVVAFSMGAAHRGLPMTGALCLAAAAAVPGSVVAECKRGAVVCGVGAHEVLIRHALGVSPATVYLREGHDPIRALGVVRTARRLFDGRVYPSVGVQ